MNDWAKVIAKIYSTAIGFPEAGLGLFVQKTNLVDMVEDIEFSTHLNILNSHYFRLQRSINCRSPKKICDKFAFGQLKRFSFRYFFRISWSIKQVQN
jgi:hypothetical protein